MQLYFDSLQNTQCIVFVFGKRVKVVHEAHQCARLVAEDAARDVHGHMVGVYQPVVVVDEDGISDNQHDQLRGCLELVETGVC
jgi:hypothetical protein